MVVAGHHHPLGRSGVLPPVGGSLAADHAVVIRRGDTAGVHRPGRRPAALPAPRLRVEGRRCDAPFRKPLPRRQALSPLGRTRRRPRQPDLDRQRVPLSDQRPARGHGQRLQARSPRRRADRGTARPRRTGLRQPGARRRHQSHHEGRPAESGRPRAHRRRVVGAGGRPSRSTAPRSASGTTSSARTAAAGRLRGGRRRGRVAAAQHRLPAGRRHGGAGLHAQRLSARDVHRAHGRHVRRRVPGIVMGLGQRREPHQPVLRPRLQRRDRQRARQPGGPDVILPGPRRFPLGRRGAAEQCRAHTRRRPRPQPAAADRLLPARPDERRVGRGEQHPGRRRPAVVAASQHPDARAPAGENGVAGGALRQQLRQPQLRRLRRGRAARAGRPAHPARRRALRRHHIREPPTAPTWSNGPRTTTP